MTSDQILQPDETTADFGGLRIAWDARVLRPRPWTTEQSRWLADLSTGAPEGRILELCCGAGQIGLLAARLTGRSLVQVDRDPVAAAYARRNAEEAQISADVRQVEAVAALEPGERFPLVLVDPPWLATSELARFPDDPAGAVDGGVDGLAAVRECLRVALDHCQDDGHVVLQVGSSEQASAVADLLRWNALDGARGWEIRGIRACSPGGVLVHIGTAAGDARAERARTEHARGDAGDESSAGQLSEVASFEGAGGPIFPADATAGYPLGADEGADGVQEGAAGPEAPPRDDDRGRRSR